MSGRKWFFILFSLGCVLFLLTSLGWEDHPPWGAMIFLTIVGGLFFVLMLTFLMLFAGERVMERLGHKTFSGSKTPMATYYNYFFFIGVRRYPDILLDVTLAPAIGLWVHDVTNNALGGALASLATAVCIEIVWALVRRGRYRPEAFVRCPFCNRDGGFWAVPSKAISRDGAVDSVHAHRHFRCDFCGFNGTIPAGEHEPEVSAAIEELERSWVQDVPRQGVL